jgi:acyl-CoA thioester hydrolase
MSEPLLTYRGAIYPWHCDHMGHMNVMWYVGKFDEATWHLLALMGFTPEYLKTQHRGMAAVEQHLTYRSELRAGDLITIYSQVLEVREKTIRFVHEMKRQDTGLVAATTTLIGVHMDTVSRKSAPIPAEIRAKIESMVADTKAAGHSL